MNLLHVLILSIVEGITEFLPISSTGHLILTSKLLSITPTDFTKTFEIAIQLGAILSVVFLYRKRFLSGFDIYKKLVVAFIPSALVGFSLYPFIKDFLLESSQVTLLSLFIGGLVLIFYKGTDNGMEIVGYKEAFKIGVFQSLSVIPGVSRAAATILGGIFSGLSRKASAEFSFLLAVPTMIGATALDIYRSQDVLSASNIGTLGLGMALSFIFAAASIKFLVDFVKKHDFAVFGVYRIILAVLFYFFVK